MKTSPDIILNHTQITHKIRRIAYQIYESHTDVEEVVLVGIKENGCKIAQIIADTLEDVSPLKVVLGAIKIDKKKPQNTPKCSLEVNVYTGKSVVIIDDVLHTGSTLIYAVKHFLNTPLKQLKTVVLVDRNHKRFPVKADYKGISLSSSLNENVVVSFNTSGSIQAILE